MGQRSRRITAAALVLGVGLLGGLSEAADAGPADQPLFPAGPITLVEGTSGLTGSIPVTNSTTVAWKVSAPDSGTDSTGNLCQVVVTESAVPASAVTEIEVVVDPVDGTCDNPTDGDHSIVLVSTPEGGGAAVKTPPLKIAKEKPAAAKIDPTGIVWPKTAFLRRKEGKLQGEITIFNPTDDDVNVTAPKPAPGSPADCALTLHSPSAKKGIVPIPRNETVVVTLKMPVTCEALDRGKVSVALVAETQKSETQASAKSDTASIDVEAEVDWGRFGWILGWSMISMLGFGLSGMVIGLWARKHKADDATTVADAVARATGGTGSDRVAAVKSNVNPVSKMLLKADTPKSWLTLIATAGTAVSALVGTTGLLKGLTGTDTSPQTTLIIAATAVSAFMIALSALIPNIPFARATIDKEEQDCPVVLQMAIAAGVTGGATAFLVSTVGLAVSRLDIALDQSATLALAYGLLAVIALYVIWSVRHYVITYARTDAQLAVTDPVTASEAFVLAVAEATALDSWKNQRPSAEVVELWLREARAFADTAVRDKPEFAPPKAEPSRKLLAANI